MSSGSVPRRAAEEGRRLADADLDGRWLLDPCAAVLAPFVGQLTRPVLEQRQLLGSRTAGD